MAKLKPKKPVEYCWLIAYVNSEYVERVHSDLARHKILMDVEAFIPTIKVLRKKLKNKEHYDYVPLYFNYGFFKVPKSKAVNPIFLEYLKSNVNCLISFVKHPSLAISNSRIKIKRSTKTRIHQYAVATEEEIAYILNTQKNLSVHSTDEVNSLYPGKVITLKGYPFDDLDAEVIEITKNHAIVRLLSGELLKQVKVSLENIYYTVYKHNQNSPSKQVSMEELGSKSLQQIYNLSINLTDEGFD